MPYKDKEDKKASDKAYREANKEKRAAVNKAWREANPEKVKAYWEANPEKKKAKDKAYREANLGKVNALTAKHKAKKVAATPLWANLERIKEIYVEAAYWNEIWPEDPVHVDHIIPLQGKTVSGLHVESNLQILRASENIKKSNSFSL
jgi:5-methylcytosine-specific restriction endonuclease McrA